MGTVRYRLYEPSKDTIERLKEIQFYMFIEAFILKYNHDNQYLLEMVESLASLFDCKPQNITMAIDLMRSPIYKPDKKEIVVGAFLLDIPIRKTSKIARIGNDTYYRYLQQYINEGQPDLEPRFSKNYRDELFKFLTNAAYMFDNVSYAVKGIDIYDEY